MEIIIADETKGRLARFGPNKLFGDYDNRQKLTDPELVALFDRVWADPLGPAVGRSTPCSPEEASSRLGEKEARFLDGGQEHREFRLRDRNMEFIVQLRRQSGETWELTQLWHIKSTDSHPKTLFVTFETVEEREAFRELATRMGWPDEALGLALIRDFMSKFPPPPNLAQ